MESLRNYRELVSRVDALCRRIEADYREHLSCRKGCSDCCRHLSLCRVEGAALALALSGLPTLEAARIRERARRAAPADPCPLLEDGVCLLYAARPLICRTHGFPVMVRRGGERQLDFCPENFRGLESLPAQAVVDLDTLKATLAAVDGLFAADGFRTDPPPRRRLTIADALLLES